ncbi:MAG: polysaccharide deacetylase family protein [Planctomycetaceae bacterium]|nr:polysaccharide deacetylase family protein [Planctomycetaceae bacterium]
MLKHSAKRAAFSAFRLSGFNALCRAAATGRLLTLCYHSVISDDRPEEKYRCRNAVSVRELREQLAILKRLFTPVSADQIVDWLTTGAALPPRPVLITFDDGYRNNLTVAADELARSGFPALVFVATGYIGSTRLLWTQELDERILQWRSGWLPLPGGDEAAVGRDFESRTQLAERVRKLCKQLPNQARHDYLERLRGDGPLTLQTWQRELYEFMNWDDVRKLAHRGLAIGSHTITHPILSRLDREELEHELQHSKAVIERELQRSCQLIAYPNGGPDDVSPAVIEATSRAGYEVGFPLFGGFSKRSPDPLVIDRMPVCGQESILRFHAIVSGTLHLFQSSLGVHRY